MGILWHFDGILVKKAMRKVLLKEFNRHFCGIFHVFSHPAIPQKSMKKPLHCRNLTDILMEISLKLHKRKTSYHYIFMALTANRVNTNNKSNDRD